MGLALRDGGPHVGLKVHPGTRFECRGCGACCGGWDVRLSPAVLTSWDESALRAHNPGLSAAPLLVREVDDAGTVSYFLARTGYSCALLEPDRRCSLHRVRGAAAKPDPCRTFPLLLLLSPAGPVVSVRPDCAEYWQVWERGPLVAEQLPGLAELLRRAPLGYWPSELVLSPGRAVPAMRLGTLQTELLSAVGAASDVFVALGAMARSLLAAAPGGGAPASPVHRQELAAALGLAWEWLAAALREALGAEPFLHGAEDAGPALHAQPYLQRLLVVAARGPELGGGLSGSRAGVPGAALQRYLLEVLRRFVINLEFARFPDLAAALGGLAACLRLLLAAAPTVNTGGAELAWVGRALAFLLRTGPPAPQDEAVLAALRSLLWILRRP